MSINFLNKFIKSNQANLKKANPQVFLELKKKPSRAQFADDVDF